MNRKTRNGGQWTEARFHSFIKSLLRKGTQKWGPKNRALQNARVSRGVYECAMCKGHFPPTIKLDNGKRTHNVFVDHIHPIINPEKGFESWDKVIERMFCEIEGLQVLCSSCHDKKTSEEKEISKIRKQKEKNIDQ